MWVYVLYMSHDPLSVAQYVFLLIIAMCQPNWRIFYFEWSPHSFALFDLEARKDVSFTPLPTYLMQCPQVHHSYNHIPCQYKQYQWFLVWCSSFIVGLQNPGITFLLGNDQYILTFSGLLVGNMSNCCSNDPVAFPTVMVMVILILGLINWFDFCVVVKRRIIYSTGKTSRQ
jgi:hypothetical protein